MNETLQSHLVSAAKTFLTAFLLAVLPLVGADLPLTQSALFGIMFAGVRAGIKAVWEILVPAVNSYLRS